MYSFREFRINVRRSSREGLRRVRRYVQISRFIEWLDFSIIASFVVFYNHCVLFFLSLQTQAAGLAAYQNRSLEFWGQINSLVPSDSSAQRDYALLTGLRLAFFFSRDRDISTIVRRVRKLQVHPEDYRSVRPMVGVRVRGWGASRLACHDDELIQHRFFL